MTTVTTYFARDLIDLGSLHDGQIGLSWWPGKAPVQVVDTPRGLPGDRVPHGPRGRPGIGP